MAKVDEDHGTCLFTCSASQPQEDGTGTCGLWGRERPDTCGDFPVFYPRLEEDVESRGWEELKTKHLSRCVWYYMFVIREGHQLVQWNVRDDEGRVDIEALTQEQLDTLGWTIDGKTYP